MPPATVKDVFAMPHVSGLAAEFESRVRGLSSIIPIVGRYRQMNKILCDLLRHITASAPYVLRGPQAQIEYVADSLPPSLEIPLRRLRFHCHRPEMCADGLEGFFPADVAALHSLCSLLAEGPRVEALAPPAQRVVARSVRPAGARWHSVRAAVVSAAALSAVRLETDDDEGELVADLTAFGYLERWLTRGTVLSLVYFADKLTYVVYEPDFLVDVTSVAACFTAYAADARLAVINRLTPNVPNVNILLGNMASLFLDDALSALRRHHAPSTDYREAAKRFFRQNALELAAVAPELDATWHGRAAEQQRHVADMMTTLLRADGNFNPAAATTELSLLGPALGLTGRADLLQTDWRLLLEQKSGKMDTFNRVGPKEDHYVQMTLYKMILAICYGVRNDHTSYYFAYSLYPARTGLLREGLSASAELSLRIMRMRNQIVHDQMRHTDARQVEADLMAWTPSMFRQRQVGDRLWDGWALPKLSGILSPLRSASALERAYVFEMLAFLQREDVIDRLGGSASGREGFAALWTASASEREEAGEMVRGLSFAGMEADSEDALADECSIALFASGGRGDGLAAEPNFRPGDPVVIYDYPSGAEPDVTRVANVRATLLGIEAKGGRVTYGVKLRSPYPQGYFRSSDGLWALEHDMIGSTMGRLARQVMSLLSASSERRSLIVGERRPQVDAAGGDRVGDYGSLNGMVERELAAQDVFLLVGPPGTGKTSVGLMNILREELLRPGHAVLILSYTNRAVDEVCSKLEKDGLDYVRIGPRFSCAEAYRGRLISMRSFETAAAVRDLIGQSRIVVGTTTAIGCSAGLFKFKRFDLAIVDEASQILEPSIVGIMSAETERGGRRVPSVGRFVLIGDERQLPAVVQQKRAQSVVTDPRLNAVGLQDCRDSFFERMIRLYGSDSSLVYRLTLHGRMHPEVASFCNEHFYGGTLRPIPLPHQSRGLCLRPEAQPDDLARAVASSRTMFFNSHPATAGQVSPSGPGDKVNTREADIVARVAHSVLEVWRAAGRPVAADSLLGIVVPYRCQIAAVRSRLLALTEADAQLRSVAEAMTIDTVERYQGSERDVIIYGFTVSSLSQLEFLKDSQFVEQDGNVVDRKLNVALSRAREQLIVVGDKDIICHVPLYAELVAALPQCEVGF